MTSPHWAKPRIGLALGSGSARGMAHLGVIAELDKLGVKPDIICGSSVGAIIGAAYALGKTREFSDWISVLSRRDILYYLDIKLTTAGGGFAHAGKLIRHLEHTMGNPTIESLPRKYAAIATDLHTGREIWLQSGPIWDAVRASIALPGILTPVMSGRHWLVDGGLVNPVPVSVCRALGADVIIAVNLNGRLPGRHLSSGNTTNRLAPMPASQAAEPLTDAKPLQRWSSNIRAKTQPLVHHLLRRGEPVPGVFEIIASSIDIMQDRITRSRLSGEPADILLSPQVSRIGLLDFDKAAVAIEEGSRCVRQHPEIREIISSWLGEQEQDEEP